MKKWAFEKEMNTATTIIVTAYLATMHSTTITATFTFGSDVYAYDLTEDEIFSLATPLVDRIQMNGLGKKRIAKILEKSRKIATINEFDEIQKIFPKQNKGYIAEFLYRIKVNNETEEEIRKSNNSKGYDIASDTKDGKQIKNLDGKATFTTFEYLIDACERKGYNKIDDVKKAIETLQKIYA